MQKAHLLFGSPAAGSPQHPVYHLSQGSNSTRLLQAGRDKVLCTTFTPSRTTFCTQEPLSAPKMLRAGPGLARWRERNQAQLVPHWNRPVSAQFCYCCVR